MDGDSVIRWVGSDPHAHLRLPRELGERIRMNRDAAVRALGGPSEGIAASIVIDGFTIHRLPTK